MANRALLPLGLVKLKYLVISQKVRAILPFFFPPLAGGTEGGGDLRSPGVIEELQYLKINGCNYLWI